MAKVLVLRTCRADMTSTNGFCWPESGPVECPDWDPTPKCGHGLHGLLWGEGDAVYLSSRPDAKWLVVEVDESDVVDLGGSVKFRRGTVVHCGDRDSATKYIQEHGGHGRTIVGATVTAGDWGAALAADLGTAIAGYAGTAIAGSRGTAIAGEDGTAIVGTWGTAIAGARGTLCVKYWEWGGHRYRLAVGYVGEDGIEPDVAYRVENGRLVRADDADA